MPVSSKQLARGDAQQGRAAGPLPLVVDLDGTLLRSDLLIEAAFAELARNPLSIFTFFRELARGKAAFKRWLAGQAEPNPALLPYDDVVLGRIRQAAGEGRPVFLVSATNRRLVGAIADHLGLFDGWWASDHARNFSSGTRAEWLALKFGERGFDYIGNDPAIWDLANKAITIRTSPRVVRKSQRAHENVEHLASRQPHWRNWVRLLRVHQYAKNLLVFVPLLTSHQFTIGAFEKGLVAFIAFSMCASSVYVLNDLADIQADRLHPSKCRRPFASGAIPLWQGIGVFPILLGAAMAIGALVSNAFLAVLLGYFSVSTAYSFFLKRKMLVDAVTLALLYVIRIFAGAIAMNITVSEWLLGFSMFFFLSLGLIKRYVELSVRLDANLADPVNRNYKLSDISIVAALAAAAGFNAVTVFAFYISSSAVHVLYRRPEILWLICPILIYWVSRALMMAHRRHMDDDPLVFALRDKNSLLAAAAIIILMLAAI